MKLTKQSLRQMIKEAIDDTKMKAGRETASGAARQFRQRAKEKNDELTSEERSLIQQVLGVLTKIASAPDVNLGRHKPQISVLMKKLQSITGAELGGDEAPPEDAEELEESATSFDPEPRRDTQQGELEVMKGRGDVQKWFYVNSIEDAGTLVRLGRGHGFPTGVTQNLSGIEIPQGYHIREKR